MRENKNSAGLIISVALFLGIFLVAESRPQWKGSITKDGDVVVIKNPKEPVYKDEILSLKEDFAIGGAEAKAGYAFSSPRVIAADMGGNIYVLDVRESCVMAFDDTGKFLRKFGRRGQGPGELGGAFWMYLPPGSNELTVLEISNSRLSTFSTDGRLIKSVPLIGVWRTAMIDSRKNVYLSGTESRAIPERYVLKKLNPDMSKVLAEIISHPQDESLNPFSPRECWILDGKDQLIYGDAKSYEIRYFSPEGRLIRRVLRDYDPLKVTKEDIDEYENRPIPEGVPPPDYSSHHGAYRSFFADDQGHLFVQTWERTADRKQDIHDIFDRDGRFIGRAALNRHSDLINPRPRFIRAGKLYTIEPDKEGYEVIKRYSVTWKVDK